MNQPTTPQKWEELLKRTQIIHSGAPVITRIKNARCGAVAVNEKVTIKSNYGTLTMDKNGLYSYECDEMWAVCEVKEESDVVDSFFYEVYGKWLKLELYLEFQPSGEESPNSES